MLHLSNSKQLVNIIFAAAIVLLLSSKLVAQKPRNVIFVLSENAIANLNTAIKSENPGLRKSAIHLAGKHSIDEVSETLLKQLEMEKNPNIRILIAKVLYKIGDKEFMDDIYKLASNDKNIKVRKMATAIYAAMEVEKSFNIADINN